MSDIVLSISLRELCQFEGVESEIVIEMVEYGIVQPISGAAVHDWEFDSSSVYWLKKAFRLYQDLEIDWIAVAVVIDLMKQNEALRKENLSYEQQLRRFISADREG
ncbi:MAG: chaperone modulator CbpM [Hahellaceae bacterium]|nr:chaperone modulator CbpM [Hahellaceae bacterium]MCP5168281.1 chaperone modulator CbpM [Hahellaceae bacterium]